MKKAIIAVAAVAATLGANAEGYQVNTLSAKQLGMAHTGTAMHLGAESMYFNPAGMAFMDKTLDMSVSVTGIFADAKAVHDGIAYKTDNNASTPIMAAAGFRIFDSLKAGVAFYTPYGSSINWTDNWPGAVLNQSVDLKVYTLQPTLAWRIMPGLSVGAGITMSWGSVNLDKGLVSAATADRLSTALGVGPVFGNTTPASVNLNGDASLRVGFNVGAMWDINRRITVGASFRSQVMMKVKAGDATLTYAGEAARKLLGNTLDVLDRANFAAEMPYLGEIPSAVEKPRGLARLKKHQPAERKIVVEEQSRDAVNEAFRVLRTNLEYMGAENGDKKCKVIAVTSANPGSGKTFISMNLAKVLAIKGKRVLVIDLDLRKGSLSKLIGKPDKGITDFLVGKTHEENIIVTGLDETEPLSGIGVGTVPPNPAELLSSEKLDRFINELRGEFDFIILDCPPVEIVTDAKVINRVADLTLFVVRAGLLEKDELPNIQEYYDQNRYRNMAILLNDTDINSGYGYHRYGYHYGYGKGYGYRYGYGK